MSEAGLDDVFVAWLGLNEERIVAEYVSQAAERPPSRVECLDPEDLARELPGLFASINDGKVPPREECPKSYSALSRLARIALRAFRDRERKLVDELAPIFSIWVSGHRYRRADSTDAQQFLDEENLQLSGEGVQRLLARVEDYQAFQEDRRWRRLGLG